MLPPDQLLDIHPFGDFILDWIAMGAGIADIARKSRIDIIQNDDPQPHAITAVVSAGIDFSEGGVVGRHSWFLSFLRGFLLIHYIITEK